MQSLRIYLMIDAYLGPIAGTERQLQILAAGLVARGHDVRLFVLRHTPFTESDNGFPCPIECLEIGSILSLDTLRKMRAFRERILGEHPDVVHAFFNDCAILAPLACSTARTRVFTSRRDMGYWYTWKSLLALALANRRAAGIVCNSHAVAAAAKMRERIRDEQLVVIHNACAPEAASIAVADRLEHSETPSNASAKSQSGEIRACLVANLRPIKRIEDLLQATALAREQLPGLSVWIIGGVGDQDYAAGLLRLTRELSLEDVVSFMPSTNRPLDIMRQCDIGVLTSASEGLSNTLMEYMYCGLPVVCTEVGGNTELVTHDQQGFLYPVGDEEALAGHLVALGRDIHRRRKLGRSGLARVAEFTPELMVDQHVSVYFDRSCDDAHSTKH